MKDYKNYKHTALRCEGSYWQDPLGRPLVVDHSSDTLYVWSDTAGWLEVLAMEAESLETLPEGGDNDQEVAEYLLGSHYLIFFGKE
jgi:hypothetical protein